MMQRVAMLVSSGFWSEFARGCGRHQIAQGVRSCLAVSLAAVALVAVSPVHAADPPAVVARPVLDTTTTWAGQPIRYPEGQARVVALEIEIAPGEQTGWHSHPVGSFAYLLEGELEVGTRDGRSHRVKAGQALAEVVGLEHNGHNVGSGPVRLVVFYTAAEGEDELTRMAPESSP